MTTLSDVSAVGFTATPSGCEVLIWTSDMDSEKDDGLSLSDFNSTRVKLIPGYKELEEATKVAVKLGVPEVVTAANDAFANVKALEGIDRAMSKECRTKVIQHLKNHTVNTLYDLASKTAESARIQADAEARYKNLSELMAYLSAHAQDTESFAIPDNFPGPLINAVSSIAQKVKDKDHEHPWIQVSNLPKEARILAMFALETKPILDRLVTEFNADTKNALAKFGSLEREPASADTTGHVVIATFEGKEYKLDVLRMRTGTDKNLEEAKAAQSKLDALVKRTTDMKSFLRAEPGAAFGSVDGWVP
eukprot:279617-Amphidinium_carterae.1